MIHHPKSTKWLLEFMRRWERDRSITEIEADWVRLMRKEIYQEVNQLLMDIFADMGEEERLGRHIKLDPEE